VGTVVAGLAGWLAALALSLAIANGDTGALGFTRALVTLEGTLTALSPGCCGSCSSAPRGGPHFTGDTSLFSSSATSACSAPPSRSCG